MWKRKETWDGIHRGRGPGGDDRRRAGAAGGAQRGRRTVPERLRERGTLLYAALAEKERGLIRSGRKVPLPRQPAQGWATAQPSRGSRDGA